MMDNTATGKKLQAGFLAGIQEGTVGIPYLLLKTYRRLKLSETDVMLLIHVMAFREKERTDFPTLEEIQTRMSAGPEMVIATLQKLIKGGFISIDQEVDATSGIQFERYNFTPLFEKMAECWIEEQKQHVHPSSSLLEESGKNIFTIFENEFGRPLTPMEMETIAGWLDKDHYKEELILMALKEAVFAGKVYFKYIDRILLDWSRNRVTTAKQAREYAQKFRAK
jgi:DNA replication protein